MKLSIIIPVYNSEHYISRCLESLLSQGITESDYEIIAIDDGSTDTSFEILKRYSANYSNIITYQQENKGPGATRNKGLELAKGDYIYFIDSDDYLAENVLSGFLNTAYANNLDVITFNTTITTSSKLKYSKSNLEESYTTNIVNGFEYISKYNYRNESWWYIFKNDHANKHDFRFLEHRSLEDAIFTLNIILYSNKAIHVPIDAHRYYRRKDSLTSKTNDEDKSRMIENMIEVIDDYEHIIKNNNSIKNKKKGDLILKHISAKQQSFLFYMMVRMMRSKMSIVRVKNILDQMSIIGVYPMHMFFELDHKASHKILAKFFNKRKVYFLLFRIFNPIFKL